MAASALPATFVLAMPPILYLAKKTKPFDYRPHDLPAELLPEDDGS